MSGACLRLTQPQVTINIQNEVEAHHRILDQMARRERVPRALAIRVLRLTPLACLAAHQGLDMDHTRGSIGGTMDRFKRVLEHKGNRSLLYVVGGVFALFTLVKVMT